MGKANPGFRMAVRPRSRVSYTAVSSSTTTSTATRISRLAGAIAVAWLHQLVLPECRVIPPGCEGAYFWQEAPHWASEWLLTKKNKRDPKAEAKVATHGSAVIEAVISLAKCLDLLDTRWVPLLENSVNPG
jgi:hypothetical protein